MRQHALALCLLLAGASAAKADDYFVSGVFVANNDAGEASAERQASLAAQCPLTPIINHKDGSFTEYYLDQLAFVGSNQLSYVKYRDGHCSLDKATQIETCKSNTYQSGQVEPTLENYSTYTTITAQKIMGHGFTAMDDLNTWKAGGSVAGNETFVEYSCADVTEAMVLSHAGKAVNRADQSASEKSLYYQNDPTPADLNLASSVLAALKK